jgi:hypothetical protein
MTKHWHRRYTKKHLHHSPFSDRNLHRSHDFRRKKDNTIYWVIGIVVVLLLFFNYGGKINPSDLKNVISDFTDTSIQHENPINKSYPVYSNLGVNGINTIELTLHESVYNYFKNDAPHEYSAYVIPDDWEKDYYKMFMSNKKDKYVINEIVNQITTSTESEGDVAVKSIALFVQKIPYDWEGFNSNDIHLKYPYETLYENKGVCSEKAILMAKLLNELGYGVALFVYEVGDHMAVGIDCPYDKSNYNSGYCFIEPSDVYPIGQIPQEYVGGADIRNEIPLVYPISQGKSYSK